MKALFYETHVSGKISAWYDPNGCGVEAPVRFVVLLPLLLLILAVYRGGGGKVTRNLYIMDNVSYRAFNQPSSTSLVAELKITVPNRSRCYEGRTYNRDGDHRITRKSQLHWLKGPDTVRFKTSRHMHCIGSFCKNWYPISKRQFVRELLGQICICASCE